MPTESLLPPIDIPNVGLWDFMFARKEKPFADDKVVLVDPQTRRSYTWKQAKDAAEAFGKGLRALWDWQKGDVLALYTPNSIDTTAVTFGVIYAGGVATTANPGYTVDELAFQLKDSGAKALATQKANLPVALEACKRVGIPDDRICLLGDERDADARYKHFTSVRNISGTMRYRRAKVDPANDLAFIVYSSGTTGHPKGVMLSHRNLISNVLMNVAGEAPNLSCEPQPDAPDGDVVLSFLPWFHIYGLNVVLNHCLYQGYKIVLMAKFDLERWCQIVEEYRVTYAYLVPPIVLLLAKSPVAKKYKLSTIKMINSGAAPLTKELVEQLYERHGLKTKQGYGMSETSPTTHLQPWDRWRTTIGAVGLLMPNQTAKYMSPEEKEVPVGEVGELWVKGPNIFLGYLNNPEGTRNALTDDGYYKTGDVGYQDKDGNFYITDRIKELIKYKGFQVPPAELEGLLASHPKIEDAAVLGVQRDDLATEVPLAYVVPSSGNEPGKALEKEIVDWLAGKVANHKKLRGGVIFTNEIPKSASGKILRRVLKGQYQELQNKSIKAKL